MRGLNPGGSASSRGEGVCHATILSTSGRCGIDYRRVPATILASANLHTITLHAKQRAISGSYGIAAGLRPAFAQADFLRYNIRKARDTAHARCPGTGRYDTGPTRTAELP